MSRFSTVVVCLLAILLVGVVFFLSKISKQVSDAQVQTMAEGSATTTIGQDDVSNNRVVPAGMLEYRSTQYNFSLLYPQELMVNEFPGSDGVITITFQNIKKKEGFQLFIAPYSESQVSDARFKQDEPSGVRELETNITIDGVTGAEFYSIDASLGATREVWFIHNGFLYEITTLKPLDSWLANILQTWEFI